MIPVYLMHSHAEHLGHTFSVSVSSPYIVVVAAALLSPGTDHAEGAERLEASQAPRQLDQPSPVPQGFSQFRVVPPEGPSSQVRPDGTASQKVAESLVLVSALRVGGVTLLPDLVSVAGQQCRVVGAEPSRLRFPGAETELLGWWGSVRAVVLEEAS